jgi:primosomal replication protein N
LEATNDNLVILEGHFISEPKFSHELFGEEFYTAEFCVNRLSDSKDILNLTLASRFLDQMEELKGCYARITGQLRSYNKIMEARNKLLLTVFVRYLEFPEVKADEPNTIVLSGYVCKTPIYRMTPFGREITDLLIAVNRHFNKTDYIPVIAWGRNAKFAKSMTVGDKVRIEGRLQSRVYTKTHADGSIEEKVAYEVSSSSIFLSSAAAEESEDQLSFNENLSIS